MSRCPARPAWVPHLHPVDPEQWQDSRTSQYKSGSQRVFTFAHSALGSASTTDLKAWVAHTTADARIWRRLQAFPTFPRIRQCRCLGIGSTTFARLIPKQYLVDCTKSTRWRAREENRPSQNCSDEVIAEAASVCRRAAASQCVNPIDRPLIVERASDHVAGFREHATAGVQQIFWHIA